MKISTETKLIRIKYIFEQGDFENFARDYLKKRWTDQKLANPLVITEMEWGEEEDGSKIRLEVTAERENNELDKRDSTPTQGV